MTTHNYSSLGPNRAGRGLSIFIGVSLVVHAVGLGTWAFVATHRDAPPFPDNAVIKTKLVKLGKQRDEKLLPRRKAAPPPKKTKTPTPPKAEKPVKADAPKVATPDPVDEAPARSSKDILSSFAEENKERPDLNKLINKVADDEGHKDGSKIGDEISGRLKADFNDKILATIKANLTAPQTLTDAERIRLQATILVRLGPGGEVLQAKVAKSSKNTLFDNAAVRAAKTAKFDPPPLQLRAFYARGVTANVCPTTCS